ncbi:hypothetical protein [Candidatus Formimonas warabiya]|uniref:Uncharacterized protein n=1 Tax=Formimonas warabiya TaxID=1761012 RepID=A0A3G1L0Q9_FORW1|nr:hypothetical protein [Candidatus Formimonas warabiya]ATW28353.1 hypothetical protein DCMF_04245 [Candidatus Formimonas warabiya]
MPQCLRCGNTSNFGSSRLPNTTPWVNGAVSALVGNFSGEEVNYLENMGTTLENSEQAFAHPERYFDTCSACGSTDIIWP